MVIHFTNLFIPTASACPLVNLPHLPTPFMNYDLNPNLNLGLKKKWDSDSFSHFWKILECSSFNFFFLLSFYERCATLTPLLRNSIFFLHQGWASLYRVLGQCPILHHVGWPLIHMATLNENFRPALSFQFPTPLILPCTYLKCYLWISIFYITFLIG